MPEPRTYPLPKRWDGLAPIVDETRAMRAGQAPAAAALLDRVSAAMRDQLDALGVSAGEPAELYPTLAAIEATRRELIAALATFGVEAEGIEVINGTVRAIFAGVLGILDEGQR